MISDNDQTEDSNHAFNEALKHIFELQEQKIFKSFEKRANFYS